jgi:hypothetical protein
MVLAETSGGTIALYTLSTIVWIIIVIATVMIASRKGYSGVLFFIFALFCSWIALIVALVMRPKPGYSGAPPPAY